MQLILYYLLYPLIWLFSQLPMKFLYALSDIVYIVIYYIIPYRKRLVFKNLRNSFPEWDEKKVKQTAKRFYRFLCDFFMESTIFIFMSEKEVMNRFSYKNPEMLNDLYSRGKSVILVFGHYGNWEYLASLQKFIKHKTLGVYKPLHIKYFDQMFIKSRQRFGMEAVAIDKIVRLLSDYSKTGTLNVSFFAADQRPLMKHIQLWTTFMHQDTPVVLGPEKLAKKTDSAVVFFKIKRIKRGYYESEFFLISDEPAITKEFEITGKFLQLLEKQVREDPVCWLWTHDRWKHKKTDYDRIFGERRNK